MKTFKMNKYNLSLLLLVLFLFRAHAQDDLLAGLESEPENDPGYAYATFKSTRVINSHSVETLSKNSLDVRISHRFGRVNSGAYNFFGLDQATIRLALEYGLSDRITLGLGRSSYQKTVDGFFKVKLFNQRKNANGMFPVSITWFSNVALNTFKNGNIVVHEHYIYRYSYAHQLIIARKFSNALSLQIAPLLIHRNLQELKDNGNDTYAVELGGRFKVSKRVSINADYIYRVPGYINTTYSNSGSIGVDIETGGHVFQLHLTNSQGMIEQMFATRTDGQWRKGDIFYGFNISRQFNVGKKNRS